MPKYRKYLDGEKFDLNVDNEYLRFACCSCGHVHVFDFDISDPNIPAQFKVTIDSDRRATAQLRRSNFGDLQTNKKQLWKMTKRKK